MDIKRMLDRYARSVKSNPKVLIISLGLVALFASTYFLSDDVGVLGNIVIISVIALAAPYFIYTYIEYAKIKEIEAEFPEFLRDVADSVRSGSSLPQSIKLLSQSDYGKLTPEIQKMANQLSWGISFQRTVQLFIKRMRRSEVIPRSMTILLESYKAGGNIAPILNSVADSVITIKEAEYEKRSLLREHVGMMYAIFFIFIGIILALTGILLPILNITGITADSGGGFSGAFKGGDPCSENVCRGIQCTICAGFTGLGESMGLGSGIEAYYKALFFSMIMMQALFSGLVAGQIGEDSLKAGIKHSLIMMGSGFAVYMLSIRLGFV